MRDETLIDAVQREAFTYFAADQHWAPAGVLDRSGTDGPVSIAATGFGLPALAVGVERGWIDRDVAVGRAERTLTTLLRTPNAARKGIFFHFLDPDTACRCWSCEASTIDTAIFLAGALLAASYFDELADLVATLVAGAEWDAYIDDEGLMGHGWKPGRGLIRHAWTGYDESLLLQILAVAGERGNRLSYNDWLAGYRWETHFGQTYAHCGPLFTHVFPHCFLDLRGRPDTFCRRHGIDYFDNARRATLAQQQYAIDNPSDYVGYGKECFGLSACDGPVAGRRKAEGGRVVHFRRYSDRGLPDSWDDGTLAPPILAAALPLAPEIVLPAMQTFHKRGLSLNAFNDTFTGGWRNAYRLAVEVGPAVLMVENHRTGLPWKLGRASKALERGLQSCDFSPAVGM